MLSHLPLLCAGAPVFWGLLSSFHDPTGARQLWLLGDGRGASRKIFTLWYCLKTELFMSFVVLAIQIQIKRVLFFWMLLIHSFFYFFYLFFLPKLDRVFLWALPVLALGLMLPCQLAVMLWCHLCHFLVQRACIKYMRNFLEPTPTPAENLLLKFGLKQSLSRS